MYPAAAAAATTMSKISITVLLFASAREAAGTSQTTLDLDTVEGCDTTDHVRSVLARQYPKLEPLVTDTESITLAVNEEYITENKQLKNGDTVALIPPISGG